MLPFEKIVIKTKPKGYPGNLNHIGDHIKAKRLNGRLQVKELAKILNITPATLINWEQGNNKPTTTHNKAVINFLGYCPLPTTLKLIKSIGQQVRLKRMYEGLTAKQLARIIGIDTTTILRWESRDTNPTCEKICKCFVLYLE
jgi:transcriptional regulator with XRE-family HTH domain